MASNLSTIGFGYPTEAELIEAIGPLADAATTRLAVEPGDYGIWRSRTGIELWFHIRGDRTEEGEIVDGDAIGLTPFFAGDSTIRVRIDTAIRRPGDNPFEGAFQAWVLASSDEEAPASDEPPEGLYPIIFDAVDFAAHNRRPMPFVATCRLTGFARDIRLYPNEAAFDADAEVGARFAARSFVPIGMFQAIGAPANKEIEEPTSTALVNGVVLDHRTLVNEASGQSMVWIEVESHGATFDVIADPTLTGSGLARGAIISAGCLLMGQIL